MAVYVVSCQGCSNSRLIRCTHEGQEHPADCAAASFGTALPPCSPETGCCHQDHDHQAAADACAGDHEGNCTRENEACPVCRPIHVQVLDAGFVAQAVR